MRDMIIVVFALLSASVLVADDPKQSSPNEPSTSNALANPRQGHRDGERSQHEHSISQRELSRAKDKMIKAIGSLTIKGVLVDKASQANPYAVQNDAITLLLDVEELEFNNAPLGKAVTIQGTLMRNIDNGGLYLTDIVMDGKAYLNSADGAKKYGDPLGNPFLEGPGKRK